MAETKYCVRCQQDKPIEDFNKQSRNADRKSSYCRECDHAAQRENRIKRRNGMGRKQYTTRSVKTKSNFSREARQAIRMEQARQTLIAIGFIKA